MRNFFLFASILILAGCAAPRVLVRDCQKLQGADSQQNCELIQKL